jgi:hypothetical protein
MNTQHEQGEKKMQNTGQGKTIEVSTLGTLVRSLEVARHLVEDAGLEDLVDVDVITAWIDTVRAEIEGAE